MSYKRQHRLNQNYDKTCPICNKPFYTKDLRLKFCSEHCREIGHKLRQKKNHREWYQKNKEYALKYQREQYHKKKSK